MKDLKMSIRLTSLKKITLSLLAALIACLLFLWLALPGIIQTQAEKYIKEKTGHHLVMNKPEFNPLTLTLHLSGLRLTKPDDKPLLAFRELEVDLSANSLYRAALVFDAIKLDGLEATAILLPDGKLNWSELITALTKPDNKPDNTPDTGIPRFDIHHLVVSGTHLDFTDQRIRPAHTSHVEPIDLDITDLSSFIGERGQYKFSAKTTTGTSLTWQGTATLQPLSATGNLAIEKLQLSDLYEYIEDSLPITPPSGSASASTVYQMNYQHGRLEIKLDDIKARLSGIALTSKTGPRLNIDGIIANGGHYDLLKNSVLLDSFILTGGNLSLPHAAKKSVVLNTIAINDIHLNLTSHQLKVGQVSFDEGQVNVARDAGGHIDIVNALQAALPKSAPATASPHSAWHYQVDKIQLKGFDATLSDGTSQFALQDIGITLTDIVDDLHRAIPMTGSFKSADGGDFEASGKITPAIPDIDIQIKLNNLNLKPAQSYLSKVARLTFANGTLSAEGSARYSPENTGFTGSFNLSNLLLNESESGELFLAWKSLTSHTLKVSISQLNMEELAIDGLDTKLHIHKDKTLSIKRILITDTSKPVDKQEKSKFAINIDKIKFTRGEMDFADLSLAMPFGTRILDLRGIISGISNEPGSLGQIQLDGQVDDFGVARAAGRINLLDPVNFMDLKVVFRNIDMNRLSPYSATFAGRKISSGKLSLDLDYKIKQRQLEGKNQVTIDKLTLGERVVSAQAHELPLDLAIALLQDSDGRIDLGLPMSGDLSDPQFSFGGIVWKMISNVISKIASAPFRALGSLFGSGDKFEDVVFDAGSDILTPPEREKLAAVALALAKRPALTVSVQGNYAESDRLALQDLQLRIAVATKSGQHLEPGEDPGPLTTHNQKIQTALESMYKESVGSAEFAALQDGYRQTNPGKLELSAAKMAIGKLSGLFRDKKTLSETDIAKLKGTDFYTILFEQLRSRVAIDDKSLLQLAANRGQATVAALTNAGAPAERISLQQTAVIAGTGRDVPVKLTLGTKQK
jgi:uncharacterized protein involved in outer membrane biogenesis/outer membrane protein OmpA-like peptidoglycan-associated protein